MANVTLVLGATSFIGRNLCKRLSGNPENKIVAVVRPNSFQRDCLVEKGNVSVIEVGMDQYTRLSRYCPVPVDAAVLLSWNGTRGASRMDGKMQKTNYEQLVSVLPELERLHCRVVVSAGSQAEYGPTTTDQKTSEAFPARPNTEYGKWKLAFCAYASSWAEAHQMRFVEPRFFSLYGEGDYENSMIMETLRNLLANRECRFTKATQLWDYLHIDDAVSGIQCLIDSPNAKGVYNFGYGESLSLFSFIQEMKTLTGSTSPLMFGAIPYPATGIVNVNPDCSRLKGLGWSPSVTFEEGIMRLVISMKDKKGS
jgi:nucleoside-diphosphate-sugar epimerase